MFILPRPGTLINLFAGVVGLLLDQVQEKGADESQAGDSADDLTAIAGIGPTFSRRLNEAGVFTYAQLANLDPEEVISITHVAEWQADPIDWIKEARLLA